jgi:hypothetical protein
MEIRGRSEVAKEKYQVAGTFVMEQPKGSAERRTPLFAWTLLAHGRSAAGEWPFPGLPSLNADPSPVSYLSANGIVSTCLANQAVDAARCVYWLHLTLSHATTLRQVHDVACTMLRNGNVKV